MDGLWPKGKFGIVAGEAGTNKSMLALDLAVAVASGQPIFGHAVHDSGPVLILSGEDTNEEVGARLWRIAEGRGLDLRDLDIRVVAEEALWLDDPTEWERVCATAAQMNARLVVLDPLRLLTLAEEKDSTAMMSVLRRLRELSQRAGCAVVLVHHYRKRSEADRRGRTADRVRGSGGLFAHARVAWLVHRVDRVARKLEVEVRAAPAPDDIPWRVEGLPGEPLRIVVTDAAEEASEVGARVLAALAPGPLCVRDLRKKVGGHAADVDDARRRLREAKPPLTVETQTGPRVMVALVQRVPAAGTRRDTPDTADAVGDGGAGCVPCPSPVGGHGTPDTPHKGGDAGREALPAEGQVGEAHRRQVEPPVTVPPSTPSPSAAVLSRPDGPVAVQEAVG